ncbi:hypothetical protein CDAR_315361 [Caerostris darwini]|uniref:Uncharacterized protein n=1 Tax=Caerostris darwini TaxID=1538125 RepID=A0AAV4VEH1_9ARAC|nr:hypothetical protein CDAR_315361 [Caerostris darwini]
MSLCPSKNEAMLAVNLFLVQKGSKVLTFALEQSDKKQLGFSKQRHQQMTLAKHKVLSGIEQLLAADGRGKRGHIH